MTHLVPPTRLPIAWATDALFTSGARSGLATKVAPSDPLAAQGHIAGDPFLIGIENDVLNNYYQWITWLRLNAGSGEYGDGSDGIVSLGGGTTTLARDMFYDSLTVPSGAILAASSFKIHVRNLTLIEAGGIIHGDGIDGTDGGAGGGGGTPATTGAGSTGGAGGTSEANGSNGTVNNDAFGGAGGAGGAAGGFSGGTAGTIGAPVAAAGTARSLHGALGQLIGSGGLIRWDGGAGGGGGASNDVASTGGGGGGGARGFVLATALLEIEATGVLRAVGGAGGDGLSGQSGGGGPGGGGALSIVYRYAEATIAAMIADNRISVAAGAVGAGFSGGASGGAGAAGTVFSLVH